MTEPTTPASPLSAAALAAPGDLDPDAPGLATVARISSPIEAEMARGLLTGAGIPCFIADLGTASVAPHLSYALGGLRVQVPEWALDEARELLAAELSQDLLPEPPDEADTARTPLPPRLGSLAPLGLVAGALSGAAAGVALSGAGVAGGLVAGAAFVLAAGGALAGGRVRRRSCPGRGCGARLGPTDAVCATCGQPLQGAPESDGAAGPRSALGADEDAVAER